MQIINVFCTSLFEGVTDEFVHEDLQVSFSQLDSAGLRHPVEGEIIAYVDWVLPDLSGMELCRRLRAHAVTRDAHITMVIEGDDILDRRRALDAGADSYVVGPIGRTMILDAILGKYGTGQVRHRADVLELGDLTVDTLMHVVRWKGQVIDLRATQFRLMQLFAQRPNALVTRREVIEGLSKVDEVSDERTVDVWIKRLRRKLDEVGIGNRLRTVHGHGYLLDLPDARSHG